MEEHGQDGDHGQAPVGELRVEFALAQGRDRLDGVEGADPAEAEIAWLGLLTRHGSALHPADLLPLREGEAGVFDEPAEGHDLEPARQGNRREGTEAIGHVGELDTHGRRQVPAELGVLRHEVPDARVHGDAAVLNLDCAATEEVLPVTVLRELERIQKPTDGWTPSSFSKASKGEPV